MNSTLLRRCSSLLLLASGLCLMLVAFTATGTLSRFSSPQGAATLGEADVNVITGTETHPLVSQNTSAIWGHGDTIVVAYEDQRGGSSIPVNFCGVSTSTDGGATFTRLPNTAFDGGGGCYGDPSVFYSVRAGKWFVQFLVSSTCGYFGVRQWESVDGINWVSSGCAAMATTPPPSGQIFSNHSSWVDNNPGSPYYGWQYIAYNDSFMEQRGRASFSTDDGVTWSAPTSVTPQISFFRVVKFTGSLGTDGTVFVQTVREENGSELNDRRINYIYRSTTAGGSWTEHIQGADFFNASYFGPGRAACSDSSLYGCMYASGYWREVGAGQAAVGPNGVVHYVYSAWPDEQDDPGDIWYLRSTNNGETWPPRVKLNTDTTKRAQWNPSLAVNAQGFAVVSWNDERNTTDDSLERYARVSTDNGLTWNADMPVSDAPFPVPLRPDSSSEVGRFNQAVFNHDGFGGDAYLTWIDGRVAINGSAQQDIFFDKVSLSDLLPPLVITTTADHDDGLCNAADCTLREAIAAANASLIPDKILFASGVTGTIQLSSALAVLTSDAVVHGPGADLLAVRRDTGGDYSVLRMGDLTNRGPNVTLNGLTILNGRLATGSFPHTSGAGIANLRGTLTLNNCILNGNHAVGTVGLGGGVMTYDGTTTITNCTFLGNSATFAGGAITSYAQNATGTLVVRNSTITGNSSAGRGGGVMNVASGTGGAAMFTATNATFSGNSAPNGGGIENCADSGRPASTTLTNVTVAYNSGSTGAGLHNFSPTSPPGTPTVMLRNTIFKTGATGANLLNEGNGSITSGGSNLSNDDAGAPGGGTGPAGYLNGTNDRRNTDPMLGTLAQNGGPTETIALLAGSPAINMADAANAPASDQRSYLRIGAPDIGAFESGGVLLRIIDIARNGDDIAVTFEGVAGKTFRLERKLTIGGGAWQTIPGLADLTPQNDGPAEIVDAGAAELGEAFYRVRLLP